MRQPSRVRRDYVHHALLIATCTFTHHLLHLLRVAVNHRVVVIHSTLYINYIDLIPILLDIWLLLHVKG